MENIKIQKYPAYKDSGVEWLGEIPEHWKILPLFSVVTLKSITNCGNRELLSVYLEKGVIRFSDVNEKRTNVTSEDLSKYQAVDPGDFVLNNQQAWRGSVGVSKYKGIVSPAYLVLSLSSYLDSHYANYLLRDSSMVAYYLICSKGVGTIQRNLYWPQLRRININIPPLSEQIVIAEFLDRKTVLIDQAVGIKEKQIDLLKERRQILIHRAVTRGLNPDVKLKDSGVEWIGEIPEGWEVVTKMKFISSLKGRQGWQGLKAEEYINEGPHVLSSAHFNNYSIDWDKCPRVSLERYLMDVHIQLKVGDILLMKDGANMGKLALVESLPGLACLNSHLLLFRSLNHNGIPYYWPKFMFYHMMCREFQDYVKINGTGSTFLGISQESIGNYPVCLPSLIEQEAIVKYIETGTAKIATAISLKEQEIEKLKEYKASLINEVVTGKVKVY